MHATNFFSFKGGNSRQMNDLSVGKQSELTRNQKKYLVRFMSRLSKKNNFY